MLRRASEGDNWGNERVRERCQVEKSMLWEITIRFQKRKEGEMRRETFATLEKIDHEV